MGHHHAHDGRPSASAQRRLRMALVLAATYLVAEVIGGVMTGSLALLADAGHMLSDVAALALTLAAMWLAGRKPTAKRTFGYHRAEVLAAFFNSMALMVIGLSIIREAVERFSHSPDVAAPLMLAVATGGLVVNVIALWLLHDGDPDSLNMRGAFLHVAADTLGSLGAMASGALIWAFDWRWADPAASTAIAVLVIFSALGLFRKTVHVLMQGTPAHIDAGEVRGEMSRCEGVVEIHDMHIWTLASGRDSLTAHVVLQKGAEWDEVLHRVYHVLRERFSLHHVTLQPEWPGEQKCHCIFED